MIKKVLEKMKKIVSEYGETIKVTIMAFVYSYMTRPISVYAASGSYTAPLDNLKVVFLTLMASAGVIVLLFGIWRFGTAFQDMDQNGERKAIVTMITGGVFIGAPIILAVMGV